MSEYVVSRVDRKALQQHAAFVQERHQKPPRVALAHRAEVERVRALVDGLGLGIKVQSGNGGVLAGEVWLEVPDPRRLQAGVAVVHPDRGGRCLAGSSSQASEYARMTFVVIARSDIREANP